MSIELFKKGRGINLNCQNYNFTINVKYRDKIYWCCINPNCPTRVTTPLFPSHSQTIIILKMYSITKCWNCGKLLSKKFIVILYSRSVKVMKTLQMIKIVVKMKRLFRNQVNHIPILKHENSLEHSIDGRNQSMGPNFGQRSFLIEKRPQLGNSHVL